MPKLNPRITREDFWEIVIQGENVQHQLETKKRISISNFALFVPWDSKDGEEYCTNKIVTFS